jgi:transposase
VITHGERRTPLISVKDVELAYTPHYASWLNRIEAQFRALRYFTLAGTEHPDHATQARLIRRFIHWRNRNTNNPNPRTPTHQHGKHCLTLHKGGRPHIGPR